MAVFDDVGAGSMLANLTADTNLIQEALSSKLAVSIGAIGNLITTMAVCFSLDWILTFMTLWLTLLGCAVLYIGCVATARYSGRSIDALAEGTAVVEEGLGTIKSTTALGMQNFIQRTYSGTILMSKTLPASGTFANSLCVGWLDKSAKNGYVLKMLNAALIGICVSSGCLNVALAFWQGLKRIADGAAPFVNVIAITMVVKSAAFCVLGVGANMESFTNGVAAARRPYRMIERMSAIDSSSEEGIVPNQLNGNIELRNVKHVYPSRQTVTVLEDVNISFLAGKMIAIVGQSGSGNSSIASLISRYYDPLDGAVSLDGIDITSLQLRWLRQRLRIVAQEPFLFNKSVYENISYGLTGPSWQDTPEPYKRKLVEEAAKVAQAHDFIVNLPQGYDTLVGSKASRLSGGQAQRIAVARALVGKPGVLILDEATSALDTETEAKLLAAMSETSCTKIVIAHRLSTIRALTKSLSCEKVMS